MLLVARENSHEGFVHRVDELSLAAEDRDRSWVIRAAEIGRVCAQLLSERRLGRIPVRRRAPGHDAPLVQEADRAIISDGRNAQLDDAGEGGLVIERRLHERAGLGEKFPTAAENRAPSALGRGPHAAEPCSPAVLVIHAASNYPARRIAANGAGRGLVPPFAGGFV